MTNKYNRIRVLYAPGETVAIAPQAYAHNSGQVLEIYGLPCDDQAVKVSFAAEGDTEAVPVVATVTGGVLSVPIPDSVLAGSGRNYKIRAFFHIVESGSVTTLYTVIIPVIDEPEMADEEPTPSQQGEIDGLIAAINTAAGRAEEAAEKAEAIQDLDARAETLAAGEAATVRKETGETGDITLVFGLPRGEAGPAGPAGMPGTPGSQGPQGPAGDPITIESSYHDGTQTHVYFSDGTEVIIPDGQQGEQGAPGEAIMITSVEHDGDAGVTAISFSDGTKVDIPDGRSGESITVQSSYHDDLTGKTYISFSDGNEVEIPDGAQGPAGPAGSQGPAGPTGPAGSDYVLTAQDKADIAAQAAALLENGDSLSY